MIGIEDSRDIALREFAISSETTVLIAALRPERLRISRMVLRARDRGAVVATAGDGVALVECAIVTQPLAAPLVGTGKPFEPGVFLAGDRLSVLRNRIVTEPGDSTLLTALGGLQIGGDSTDVEIADNLIQDGNNAGIVLGSIDFVLPPVIASQQSLQAHYAARRALPTYASWLTISDDDCINIDPHPQPPDDPNQPTPDPGLRRSGGRLPDREQPDPGHGGERHHGGLLVRSGPRGRCHRHRPPAHRAATRSAAACA